MSGPSRSGTHHRCPGASLALALALLTGCGGPAAPRGDDALAVVVGAHANAPRPVASGAVADALDQAVRAQASATVVVNSGVPVVLSQGALTLDCHNPSSCAQARQANTTLLRATVAAARAETPESNLLAAIDLGARALADHRGRRTLVVIDSGLQTVPPMRLTELGALAADPDDVADYLARIHQLPDLAGVAVLLAGLGDTAPPQPPLSTADRSNLVAMWVAVLRRAGAVDVQALRAPLSGPAAAALPPVAIVPVTAPVSFDTPTIELPETVLPFEHDTAVLRDPVAARGTLTGLATRIAGAHGPVTVTGATANVGPLEGQRALGAARAETVKNILTQLGVPAELIRTRGVGSDWPGYLPDRDAGGALLPTAAARNRRVVVTLG